MGITRRGEWKTAVDSNTQAIDPKDLTRKGAKAVGGNTSATPILGVSGKGMGLSGLSDFRKEAMFNTHSNDEREELAPVLVHSATYKTNQSRAEFTKTAESVGSVFNRGVGGHTVRQGPEIYSPLFQMANLQLPRDRITMNAWNRNFYDTHPLVHNCINLHATYPISKISIKCKNRKIEQFFNEMAQNLDLIGALQAIAQEFWMLGEKIDGASMITMADGTLKPISEIQIGDMVLTHLGNKKRVIERFVKPTSTVIEEHLKIHKLTIGGLADPLIISGKHPVLSMGGSKLKCQTSGCRNKNLRVFPDKDHCGNCHVPNTTHDLMPDFIAANDLKPQDIVYAPFNRDVINDPTFTEDLCYIMGYWLAEGCYCKAPRKDYTKYNGIKFCSFDNDFLENRFIPLFEQFAGCKGHKYTSKSTHLAVGKDKYDYWFEAEYRNGPALANFFLEHCGEFSKTKRLSETVMSLPPQMQRNLLAGFIDGDGCIDQDNNHALLYTSSRVLANQFMLILRRLGAHPTCSKHRSVLNGKPGGFSYKIRVVADEAHGLFTGLLRSKKAELLKMRKWSSCRTGLQNNWQLLAIREMDDITEHYTDSFMYDIEVEDDHSYIANGIAIHNCFPYAELDESRGVWRHITIQNPDFIHVKKSPFGEYSISLRPDPALLRLVQSSSPDDLRLISKMDKELVYHVRKGNSIPLDNFHVSHLKMLRAPYDIHGTSVIVSVYKDLMLYDKIRESKFAQADNMINPITLIKVGGTAEGEFHPTQGDLENYRQIFESAQYDRDFKVITHAGVSVERVGASGQIIDIAADLEFIMNNIFYGLMCPKAVITQEGAAFQSASIGLEVLKQRYESFRNMMAQWLTRKIFAPISEIQGFYEYVGGDKHLIVPEIDWNQMNLYDMDTYITAIKELSGGERPVISKETLFRSLGLNIDEERRRLKQEAIQNVIAQKELQLMQQLSLGSLRALKPDSDLIEPNEQPLPGVGMPSEESGPGGLGVDLGAPPDLSGGLGLPPPTSTGTPTPPPTAGGTPATPPPAAPNT